MTNDYWLLTDKMEREREKMERERDAARAQVDQLRLRLDEAKQVIARTQNTAEELRIHAFTESDRLQTELERLKGALLPPRRTHTMYVYIKSEPAYGLYTVGFYSPDGKWNPDSDHSTREEAAARVHYLNGGVKEQPGANQD